MKTTTLRVLLTTTMMFSGAAFAADELTHEGGWGGGAEINANITSGNTDIQTVGASAEVDFKAMPWTTSVKAGFMRNRTDGIDRARRITGALRTGTNITNNVDFFALGTYMQNRFRGIEHQYMVTPGIGIYPINSDQISIRFEGGLGWMKEEYTIAPAAMRNFTVGTVGLGMRFKLTDVADLTNDLLYILPISNSDDWRLNNTAGIVTAMSNTVSLKVAHIVEYRKLPVPGFHATDNTTTAGVILKF